ncbi:MAG: hypothetical protein NC254_00625 [bacterium]|nr:hypothetical protein [bacterium]
MQKTGQGKTGQGKTGQGKAGQEKERAGRETAENGRSGSKGNPFSVSQNFITGHQLISRLIRLSRIEKNDTVLEIGTGKGHLTEALCEAAGYVYSVEIDHRMYESAGKRLKR